MDCNVILIDNNSEDEGIKKVINGFKKRNLFYDVYEMDSNCRDNLGIVFKEHYNNVGDYFFFIESDVQILTDGWMSLMMKYYKSDKFGFLGSAVDQSDFINIDDIADGGDVGDNSQKNIKDIDKEVVFQLNWIIVRGLEIIAEQEYIKRRKSIIFRPED